MSHHHRVDDGQPESEAWAALIETPTPDQRIGEKLVRNTWTVILDHQSRRCAGLT